MIAGPNPGVYQGLYVPVIYFLSSSSNRFDLLSQNLPNTSVSNVSYGRHGSEEEARQALNNALDKGTIKWISDGTTVVLTRADVYSA